MLHAAVFLVFLVGSVFGTAFEGVPFVKKNCSFVRVVENKELDLTIKDDFVPTISKLLDSVKNGTNISPDSLNKFNDGITQYYLSRALEYFYVELKPVVNIPNFTDPIPLPNVKANDSSDISFFDVKVYGFPPFKNNFKLINELTSNPYFQQFEVLFKAQSDTVIFTGNFTLFDETYFFVYVTFLNTYTSEHRKVRDKIGVIRPKVTTDTFTFVKDKLSHTYDSFLVNFQTVNEKLPQKLDTALENVYLPILAVSADLVIEPKLSSSYPQFSELHRKKVLQLLVESAVQYASLSGFTNFTVSPLPYKPASNKRGPNLLFSNITIDSLLHFTKYEFSDPHRTANQSRLALSDKLKFYYPESGDELTCISFTIQVRRRKTIKRVLIKSVEIETAFIADVSKNPPELLLDEEALDSKAGLKISFEPVSDEPVYDFVIEHAAEDLTRAISSLIFGTVFSD